MLKTRLTLSLGVFLTLIPLVFSQDTSNDNQQASAPANQSSTPPNTEQPPASSRPEVPGPLPDSAAESKRKGEKTEQELEMERKEQSQKILGVVPQFSVTNRRDASPLTPREKFRLMTKSVVNPFEFVATGFQAGLSQATDEFPEYGQGAEGYGKRYGAAFADQASSQFFANYLYPVLLKEDPRYFRLGEGTFQHRVLYSLVQEFSAVKDDRTRTFNFSNVLGAFSSGLLSNAYYPEPERGIGNTMSRSVIALAYGSVGGLVDEFWPDVQQKWASHRKKKREKANQQ